jgi:hypothetical protein
LPVAFNKCGKWSFKLREKERPRVFDDIVLRKIFGPKQEEITGEVGKILY